MSYPSISIIVPVYKVENSIQHCIESILQQTYTDWELILVDDGSPDSSGKICDQYAQKDFRIHSLHQKNGGVSSARNYGLKNVTGKWIVFIDSDDYVEPTYLEDFFLFRNEITLNTIVIQGLIYDTKNSKTFRQFSNTIYNSKEIAQGLIENTLLTFGGPYCKLYNAYIINKYNIKFPLNYSYGEDTIFFLRYLAYIDTLILVSSCNYHYIEWNQESLSHKSHRFEELKSYMEDNLSAIKELDKRFTSSHLLMKSHGNSIDGIMKKMILDIYRLKYEKKIVKALYEKLKKTILSFHCYKYSTMALCFLLIPITIAEYIINIKLKKLLKPM